MAEHEHCHAKNAAVPHNTSTDRQLSALEYAFKINPVSEA